MGRPTKYKEEMPGRVVELMSEGASLTEVAADLGISHETLNVWSKDETKPKFSEAIKRGIQLSEAWWQGQGRTNLKGKDFNSTLWYMNMKNRFGWADKNEHRHSGEVKLVKVNTGIDRG